MPVPNQTALLAQIKSDLLARGVIPPNPTDNRAPFEITARLAWALRGQGARLIRKGPAQNGYTISSGPRAGERYSHDAISFPDGWVDCLASAGPPANENRPSWGWSDEPRDPSNSNTAEPFDLDAAVAPTPDPQAVVPTPPQPAAVDGEAARTLVQISTLLEAIRAGQDADRELQHQILATLEGIRRDLDNTGKLLVAAIGSGGIGNIANVADLFKR